MGRWLMAGLLILNSSIAVSSERITIIEMNDYQADQQLLFDAHVQFNLPNKVIEAIHNEIGLTFKTQIVFEEHQTLMGFNYDRERLRVQYHTQLRYSSFSNEYTLINERNNNVQSFRSLDNALTTLGTLAAFPLISLSELHPNQKYTLRVNINLNRWRLPAPLVLISLLESDWALDSEWFETQIYTPKSWL